jgi:hypothetical protein
MGFEFVVDTSVMDEIIDNDDQRDRFIRGVGVEMVGDMQISMTDTPKTGKRYGKHIASSPGHPPAVDTGVLRASIKLRKIRAKVYAIQTDVLYGRELELLKNRPWMRPVFVRWTDKLPDEAQRFFDREVVF